MAKSERREDRRHSMSRSRIDQLRQIGLVGEMPIDLGAGLFGDLAARSAGTASFRCAPSCGATVTLRASTFTPALGWGRDYDHRHHRRVYKRPGQTGVRFTTRHAAARRHFPLARRCWHAGVRNPTSVPSAPSAAAGSYSVLSTPGVNLFSSWVVAVSLKTTPRSHAGWPPRSH